MEATTVVTSPIIWNTPALDAIARAILADNTAGVSTADYSVIVLLNDTPELITTAEEILNGHAVLTVEASPAELVEGTGDVTITCDDALIAGDADVGYVVLLDGGLYASGTDAVTGGSVTLSLVDPVDGEYAVYIYRLTDMYESGFVRITVTPEVA